MDSKTYMWPQADNKTPMVGRKVNVDRHLYACEGNRGPVEIGRFFLMQPLYRTTCEWVLESDLREYVGGRGT